MRSCLALAVPSGDTVRTLFLAYSHAHVLVLSIGLWTASIQSCCLPSIDYSNTRLQVAQADRIPIHYLGSLRQAVRVSRLSLLRKRHCQLCDDSGSGQHQAQRDAFVNLPPSVILFKSRILSTSALGMPSSSITSRIVLFSSCAFLTICVARS